MTPEVAKRITGLAVVPLALLLHNVEEALGLRAALPRLEVAWSGLIGEPVILPSAQQYYLALLMVTALAFGVFLLARSWDPASYALVVLQGIMALNVVTHVFGAILFRGYAPGLITAVVVEGPVSAMVFQRVRRAGWLSRTQWRLLPLLVVFLHGPALLALLAWVRTQ
jgi:hypothetical protein